jgi:hypothetical protein
MINELDEVILTRDLPEHGLSAGVLTLLPHEVGPVNSGEIAHVRELAAR